MSTYVIFNGFLCIYSKLLVGYFINSLLLDNHGSNNTAARECFLFLFSSFTCLALFLFILIYLAIFFPMGFFSIENPYLVDIICDSECEFKRDCEFDCVWERELQQQLMTAFVVYALL